TTIGQPSTCSRSIPLTDTITRSASRLGRNSANVSWSSKDVLLPISGRSTGRPECFPTGGRTDVPNRRSSLLRIRGLTLEARGRAGVGVSEGQGTHSGARTRYRSQTRLRNTGSGLEIPLRHGLGRLESSIRR